MWVHWVKNCSITFNLHDKLFYSVATIVVFNNGFCKNWKWDGFLPFKTQSTYGEFGSSGGIHSLKRQPSRTNFSKFRNISKKIPTRSREDGSIIQPRHIKTMQCLGNRKKSLIHKMLPELVYVRVILSQNIFFNKNYPNLQSYILGSSSIIGRVELWIFVLIFSTTPAWRKQLQIFNFQKSTSPNRWAAH